MLKLIWSKLSKIEKGAVIVVGILVLVIGYQGAKIAYLHHQRVKYISKQIEDVLEKRQQNEKATQKSIKEGKGSTQKAVSKSKAIDKKLQDEKDNIDNSDYPISRVDSLITSYD